MCARSLVMSDSMALQTVAHQALLFTWILQARILERVAMPSSRGSSPPKHQTCVSCVGRQALYH